MNTGTYLLQTSKQVLQIAVNSTELASSEKAEAIRVLHVDDDPSFIEISKLILQEMGSFEIDCAGSVDEAFRKLETQTYDAVISDYEMPQKDGLQFLKQLREQDNSIPFILFTGKGREEVAIKALNFGASGYYNKQGSPETVYGELSHGIKIATQRDKAELQLRKSEEQLNAIISNAPIGIAISDPNQFFLNANERFCKILGFSENELRKLTFKELTLKHDVRKSIANMGKLISGKLPFFSDEKRYVRKDGTIIDGKVTVSAIRDKNGKPTLFVAELEDVTERKKSELEKQEKYEALERVAESIGAGLAIIGRGYNVLWANSALRNLGVAPNKKCYETFNNLDRVCPDCGVIKIFEENLPFDSHEYKSVDSKGEVTWVELRVTPLKDKNGNTTTALELALPINERKQSEDSKARTNIGN